MKTKLALILTLVSVGVHVYLSLHYYDLNYGISSTESVCNLNSTFNCDSVSASPYATLIGIPIALWGVATNLILALMIFFGLLGWVENINRHKRATLWLGSFVAATSLVMGFISTFQLGTYCIFCIAAYLLSFVTAFLIRLDTPTSQESIFSAAKALFSKGFNYALTLAAIPVIAFFIHKSYMMNIGADKISPILKSTVLEWQTAAPVDLTLAQPSLVKGSQNPKMIISEFADFRCGHCKQAAKSLNAFANSRNDVQVQFYSFPLDGTCNDVMRGGGDGISCHLAKAVLCSEKTNQKGWALHDFIFENQEKINSMSLSATKDKLNEAYKSLGIPAETQSACIESTETDQLIRSQAKVGENAGIQGTPTIFVNGKKMARGQVIRVLEEAYKSL